MSERQYLGRSGGGGRVGIYLEERDWERRAYVGKDAVLPCAIERRWTDSLSAWDLLFFDDLGHATVSTSTAIASCITGKLTNNYTVSRRNFNLHIRGCAFYREDSLYGPRTRGVLDLLTDTVVPWPDGATWESIVNADHFEFAPKGVR